MSRTDKDQGKWELPCFEFKLNKMSRRDVTAWHRSLLWSDCHQWSSSGSSVLLRVLHTFGNPQSVFLLIMLLKFIILFTTTVYCGYRIINGPPTVHVFHERSWWWWQGAFVVCITTPTTKHEKLNVKWKMSLKKKEEEETVHQNLFINSLWSEDWLRGFNTCL